MWKIPRAIKTNARNAIRGKTEREQEEKGYDNDENDAGS
jgi:hypothetical protein